MENRPQVGVAVIIIKDGKVLALKRKNAVGTGTWGFIGGHLEYKESWEDCIRREVAEEVGITIKNIKFGTVTNTIFEKEDKHYVSIIMVADFNQGEVKNLEPDKCEAIEWVTWENLPHPLYQPVINILTEGFNPFNI